MEVFIPVNTRVSSVDIYAGTQMILDYFFFYKWPTWICCASLSGLSHPIQLFWQKGLTCVIVCLRTSTSSPGLKQHASFWHCGAGEELEVDFNHSTLSVDTIRDQWHFPLLKKILFSDLETVPMNSVTFPPRCVFQGDAACAPQHSAALVSMLIGGICWFPNWTGSFEPDLYLNGS